MGKRAYINDGQNNWIPLVSSLPNMDGYATEDYVDIKIDNLELLPPQSGNAGKFLTTDGSDTSWAVIDLSDVPTTNSPTFTGEVVIDGDLVITGATVELNAQNVLVEDNFLTLNSSVSATPVLNAGIEVERGTSSNVFIRWNESTDTWQYTNDGSEYYNLGSNVRFWKKTLSGGQTSVSGEDDNAVTLSYTPGLELVYLNGVKLIRTEDYVPTSASVISNLDPVVAGSTLEVISFEPINVANTYTRAEIDSFVMSGKNRWTKTISASTSLLTGLDNLSTNLSYTSGTEELYINGVLQARNVDYTPTSSSLITLETPVAVGDIVEVISEERTFTIGNTYTKQQVDSKLLGYQICTNATRPLSPIAGQMIYETDTQRVFIYSGATWRPIENAGTPIQYVYSRTDSRGSYSVNNSGNGTEITPLTISITPKRSNSMIVIEWNMTAESTNDGVFVIWRNGSLLSNGYNTEAGNNRWSGYASHDYDADTSSTPSNYNVRFIDFPGTVSTTTYSIATRSSNGNNSTFYLNRTWSSTGSDSYEVGTSLVTAMEVAV